MRDGVKGSSKVEEDEDGEQSRVCCTEEVIVDFNQGCFSTVFRARKTGDTLLGQVKG